MITQAPKKKKAKYRVRLNPNEVEMILEFYTLEEKPQEYYGNEKVWSDYKKLEEKLVRARKHWEYG